MNPNLILPVGTQVVSRVEVAGEVDDCACIKGAVGVIIKSPTDNSHAYRVRLPDGQEITLNRHEFSIRKHFQAEGIGDRLSELKLYDYVIYRCIVGSQAFGLADENSDIDRRGIYLPPAELHWSLYGIPEQLENQDDQECYWELQKFIILALKANPNVLECLYTPLVEKATPLAEELLSIREIFLSKLVYQTYNGYVMSQFKKMERDLRARGQVRLKHAMHSIRLLIAGISILEQKAVPVKVEAHREALLSIRHGEMSWDQVDAWRLRLHQDFERAFRHTTLPERPNYERANTFLIKARRSQL